MVKLGSLFKPGTGGEIPNWAIGLLLREYLSPEHKEIVRELKGELGGKVPPPESKEEKKARFLAEAARLKAERETV